MKKFLKNNQTKTKNNNDDENEDKNKDEKNEKNENENEKEMSSMGQRAPTTTTFASAAKIISIFYDNNDKDKNKNKNDEHQQDQEQQNQQQNQQNQEEDNEEEQKQKQFNWFATHKATIDYLSVFDFFVYLIILINFIAHCLKGSSASTFSIFFFSFSSSSSSSDSSSSSSSSSSSKSTTTNYQQQQGNNNNNNENEMIFSEDILNKIIQITLIFFIIELIMRFIAYKHHILPNQTPKTKTTTVISIIFDFISLFLPSALSSSVSSFHQLPSSTTTLRKNKKNQKNQNQKTQYHIARKEFTFDFIITLCGILSGNALNIFPYCGLFSFLRILNFRKIFGPRVGFLRLLEATENAYRHIVGSLLIIGFGFFLFAVLGVELFRETSVPPLPAGWSTEYRNMNSTPAALKLLFDANSGDNWIDFPSDYSNGFKLFSSDDANNQNNNNNQNTFEKEQNNRRKLSSSKSSSERKRFRCEKYGFLGNHKIVDAVHGFSFSSSSSSPSSTSSSSSSSSLDDKNHNNKNKNKNNKDKEEEIEIEEERDCRHPRSLVRWYFILSDLILSIVGPAFVGAVMYDALVLQQDEVSDRCRAALQRFHKCWNSATITTDTNDTSTDEKNKNEKNKNEKSFQNPKNKKNQILPVSDFIKTVLARLPKDITNFAFDVHKEVLLNSSKKKMNNNMKSKSENENDDNETDQEEQEEDDNNNNTHNENEDLEHQEAGGGAASSRNLPSVFSSFSSSSSSSSPPLPRSKELLSFLLRTPIPLRRGNLVSFDGALSSIIIAAYKLDTEEKAERVLGGRAFGQLAKMLNECKVFTVAHYVAVKIIVWHWRQYRRVKMMMMKTKMK